MGYMNTVRGVCLAVHSIKANGDLHGLFIITKIAKRHHFLELLYYQFSGPSRTEQLLHGVNHSLL